MTNEEKKKEPPIRSFTLHCIRVILDLISVEERNILCIRSGTTEVPLVEQLYGRWRYHEAICKDIIAFRAKAAHIIEANRGWIQFLDSLKKDDIFGKLLDPNNYAESNKKRTRSKILDKRQYDGDGSQGQIMKSIGRSSSGDSGQNKTFDYTAEWDKADRKRLDRLEMKISDSPLITTETGQEDDSFNVDPSKENEEDLDKWIDKDERLDHVQARRLKSKDINIKFYEGDEIVSERPLLFHNLGMTLSNNASSGQLYSSQNQFAEAIKRQGYSTTRERIILADAINKIHNVEFINPREKFLQKLDSLFRYSKPTCP